MDDDIPIIHYHPAVTGVTLLFSLFAVFRTHIIKSGIGKSVEHTVTGTGADDKIIGKRCNVFQIEQDNILPFFIFQGIYDVAGKFKGVQMSPLCLVFIF